MSCRSILSRLRKRRTAPDNKTALDAICITTRIRRRLGRMLGRADLEAIATERSPRSGNKPHTIPQAKDTTSIARRIRTSSVAFRRNDIPSGASEMKVRSNASAKMQPTTALTKDTSSPSVTVWRKIRLLPAPNAARIANSCSRAAVRARNRLPAFAQHTNNTTNTVPSIIQATGITSCTWRSRKAHH